MGAPVPTAAITQAATSVRAAGRGLPLSGAHEEILAPGLPSLCCTRDTAHTRRHALCCFGEVFDPRGFELARKRYQYDRT